MKKPLALTLALALCLALAVPALAAEDPTGAYYVDGEPVEVYETPPMLDEDYTYNPRYEQYIADHPEEFENLDVDALIAGWGYEDINMTAQEAFMNEYYWLDDTLERTVAWVYASNRWQVQQLQSNAEGYKERYPEAWAAFDADEFLAATVWEEKADYMAENNLLTDEEFVDYLFAQAIEAYGYQWTYKDDLDAPDPEPTLTLVVNGVASDIPIAANDWTTYADAADLRALLGGNAVDRGYQGPVPVREAAENAGWEVQWYDGGWQGVDQQVCLWNKDLFLAETAPRLAAYQQLMDAAMGLAKQVLFAETPRRQTQTATLNFKRFDTLDGDKTYTVKLRAESVCQKGVVDMTLTFDASQLLPLLPAGATRYLAQNWDLGADKLKSLLSAGKLELIVDYNQGAVAVNAPLLGALSESMAGWHTLYLSDLGLDLAETMEADYAQNLYDAMLDSAQYMGGVAAREIADSTVKGIQAYAGPDNVKKTGSTVTYTLKTAAVNAALSKLIGDGDQRFSFFKKYDVTMTISGAGRVDATLALRPDLDGIAQAAAGEDYGMMAISMQFMPDFDLSAAANGDLSQSAGTVKLHVKNFGVFDLTTQSATKSADQGPRQIAQVERLWVEPKPGDILTRLP